MVVFFLAFVVSSVLAYSSGRDVLCNTEYEKFGSIDLVESSDRIMWWAKPPMFSANYSLRTGDGELKHDPTTYIPNQYLSIHIRVLHPKMKFNGLLLYAVDRNETKVGEWVLPSKSNFWLPQTYGCDGKAVLHNSAQVFNYHENFLFLAPKAGTGPITFRSLIKQGQAFPNLNGAFFWPNEEPLTMTEKKITLFKPTWVQGKPGQSCNTVCTERIGGTCDPTGFETVNSSSSLSSITEENFLNCRKPFLGGGCGPTSGSEGCWYYDNENCQRKIDCSFKDDDVRDGTLLCPCSSFISTSMGRKTTTHWFSFITTVILTILWCPKTTKSMLALLLICTLSIPCDAHNWLTNPARTYRPSFVTGSKSNVHIQVGAGQKFPVEWSTGHRRGSSYFILLKAEDESTRIQLHNHDMLRDYLDNAPAKNTYMKDDKRYFVSAGHSAISSRLGEKAASNAIERPSTHLNRVFSPATDGVIYEILDQSKVERATYTNPNYPWIIAVHSFKIDVHLPKETEISMIEFPSGTASGSYVIHWMWEGYQTAIDVNVLPKPSNDLYGRQDGSKWKKVDHCQMTSPVYPWRSWLVFEVEPPSEGDDFRNMKCSETCSSDRYSGGCTAIGLVPLSAPALYPFQNYKPNMPEGDDFSLINKNSTNYVCWISQRAYGGSPTPVVGEPYLTSNDPEDPVFYSTCWFKVSIQTFNDTCASCQEPPQEPRFRFHDHCISCETAQRRLSNNNSGTPFWRFDDECRHCDSSLAT